MDLNTLREHRVGVLASGGLSSTTVGAWLAEKGVETVSYVADIGQTAPFTASAVSRLLDQRSLVNRLVDLRKPMAETYIDLIRYQATYDGGYWNTTGAARAVLVGGLVGELRADGCTVLVHGCVGGGNDQARFDRYAAALAPELAVFTPWTRSWFLERFPHRASMTEYLLERGYPSAFDDSTTYSVDGNLGGYSHESGELEALATRSDVIRPIMTTWPRDAPDTARAFRVRFEAGNPVEIDGRAVDALEAVELANDAGRRSGISVISVVENRMNGTKCRGVYEAPGLEVLGRCLNVLYQATMDKDAADLARTLFQHLGRAVYEGTMSQPAALAAQSAADLLTQYATGTIDVDLYKGNVLVNGVYEIPELPGTERQTRFTNGGHAWHVQNLS